MECDYTNCGSNIVDMDLPLHAGLRRHDAFDGPFDIEAPFNVEGRFYIKDRFRPSFWRRRETRNP